MGGRTGSCLPFPPVQRQHQAGGEAGVVVFQEQSALVELHDAGDEAKS